MKISKLHKVTVYFMYCIVFVYTTKLTENTCMFDPRCKCYNSNLRVTCINKNITSDNIPHFPRSVQKLSLWFNLIEIIPRTTFNHMNNLTELDLSSNRLIYLEEGTFDGLSNLQTLSIKGNYLNYSFAIPNNIFKPLVSLKHLNVGWNNLFEQSYQFPTFPSDLLSFLDRLESIEVDAIQPDMIKLFKFPDPYRSLTHLKKLEICLCVLPYIQNVTFFNLQNLEYLDMHNCHMKSYDRWTLRNGKKLKYLDISQNDLTDESLSYLMSDLYFHDKLEILKMTNSFPSVYVFVPQYFAFDLNATKIKEIYANTNSFVEAVGTEKYFMLPPTLKVCDFANNKLSKFYFGMPYLSILNLRNNTLGAYLSTERYTNSSNTELKEVDLSFNFIQDLSFAIFHGHEQAVKIDLSHNKLTDVNFDLSHLVSLERLDLSYNNISGISSQTSMDTLRKLSKTSKLKIDLSNNLLKCSCQNLKFLQWMDANSDLLMHVTKYTCRFDNNNVIQLTNVNAVVKQLEKECSSFTTLIICITTGIIMSLFILSAGLVYRFRWRLRYLYYMTRHKYKIFQNIQSNTTYKYDAFISYANEETDFIVSEVIPHLERDENLKLCVHQRDFVPGEDITQNITNGIHQSRFTLCIVTQSFLDSYYCMFEFNMARMESIYSRAGQNILFLVFYEQLRPKDLPLVILELVQKQSYIEYPNDEQGNVVFWKKIAESLGSSE
ncbi:toll-like receptor 13 [Mytilus galloprovincialis]|uniref:Toll-like receptor 13 n=2 Tax=Mytilus galloprovincialis TaxID=29158 RepID=A0A8B6E252_MYTGA|nr:toll-like receptor 13 [Mytilus galloprovincialis]